MKTGGYVGRCEALNLAMKDESVECYTRPRTKAPLEAEVITLKCIDLKDL